MYIQGGQLFGRFTNGGTSGTIGPMTYIPVAHRFLRIREVTGDARLRKLRSRGQAMDWKQASAYACTHIEEFLSSRVQGAPLL